MVKKYQDAFCAWCQSPVKMEVDFDETKEKAVCNAQCYWAEKLFCKYYSDYEIYMRREFDE